MREGPAHRGRGLSRGPEGPGKTGYHGCLHSQGGAFADFGPLRTGETRPLQLWQSLEWVLNGKLSLDAPRSESGDLKGPGGFSGAGRKLVSGGWLLFPHDPGARQLLKELCGCVFTTFPKRCSTCILARYNSRPEALSISNSNIKKRLGQGHTPTCQLAAFSTLGEASLYVPAASVSLSVVLRMSARVSGHLPNNLNSRQNYWPKVLASRFLALWTLSSAPPPFPGCSVA